MVLKRVKNNFIHPSSASAKRKQQRI